MSTATKKPQAAFNEDGSADLFVIREANLYQTAKVWLERRGIAKTDSGLYVLVIDPAEDRSIRLPEWKKRIDALLKTYRQEGWFPTSCGDGSYHLFKTVKGLPMGIEFDRFGVGIHQRWSTDTRFLDELSATGYHHLEYDDVPDPEILERDIERVMQEVRREKSRLAAILATPPEPETPIPEPKEQSMSTATAFRRQPLPAGEVFPIGFDPKPKVSRKDAKAQSTDLASLAPLRENLPPAAATPEQELPLASIVDSPYQHRETHSEGLEGLRDTLVSHGLLQAVVVRPLPGGRFELLAGHRRCAAARLAGWTTIRARVQPVDDATAEELVVIENLLRKDLSAIEEARGFQALLKRPGTTQESLAARLGISQGQVANRLRLLRLPAPFQAAIMSGEITASDGRELVAVADIPSVTKAILEEQKKKWHKGNTLGEVIDHRGGIESFIEMGTREVEGGNYVMELGRSVPHFVPTDEERAKLDIRKFPKFEGSKQMEERACNADLWDSLQAAHVKALLARSKKKADKDDGKSAKPGRALTPAERKAAAEEDKRRREKMAKQYQRRRQELVVDRLRHLIAERLLGDQTTETELLELATTAALGGWAEGYKAQHVHRAVERVKAGSVRERAARMLAELFWDSAAPMPARLVYDASKVRKTAALLGVDGEAAWKRDQLGPLTEAWWSAHPSDELRRLCELHSLGTESDAAKGTARQFKKSECIRLLSRAVGLLPAPAGLKPAAKKEGPPRRKAK